MTSRSATVWRITSARFADRLFDGEGARLYGGRWNFPGVPMVYCASTLSLAALEYLVHLDPGLAPPDLATAAAEIPEGLEQESIADTELPASWRDYPAPEALREIGTRWSARGESAVLWVPSVVIPRERNALLNPRHPHFGRLLLLRAEPFSFDPRLWKTAGPGLAAQ